MVLRCAVGPPSPLGSTPDDRGPGCLDSSILASTWCKEAQASLDAEGTLKDVPRIVGGRVRHPPKKFTGIMAMSRIHSEMYPDTTRPCVANQLDSRGVTCCALKMSKRPTCLTPSIVPPDAASPQVSGKKPSGTLRGAIRYQRTGEPSSASKRYRLAPEDLEL